jgi:hypothetical protein
VTTTERSGEPQERERTARTRRRKRRLLVLAGLVLLGLLVAHRLHRDPAPHILARRGELAEVVEGPLTPAGEYFDQEVRLVSTSGLEVELALRLGTTGSGPLPAILLLGGHRTGRKATRLIPGTPRAVVATMSYPTKVERIRGPADVLDARRGILDTPAAVMLCADYLCGRADVDPARVELVGVSLGAPFACVAGALDARFARVWSIHGGGSPPRLLASALRRELSSPILCWIAGRLLAPLAHGIALAPEAWAGRIAPRPFVMVNGLDDAAIPRACVEILHEAAREPKELVWVPGGHIDKRKEEQIRELCELVLARLEAP